MPINQRPNARPQRFAELVGNRKVIEPLTRAITRDLRSNVLLITGPTGSGKTTLARAIARRLLCKQADPGDIEGCGVCLPCTTAVLKDYWYFEEVDCAEAETEVRFNHWQLHDPAFVYFVDEVQELPRRSIIRLRKKVEDQAATVIFATTHVEKLEVLDDALFNRLKSDHHELLRPTRDEVANYLERQTQTLGVKYQGRQQLLRVADGYDCEMRPIAKFMQKVLAETEGGTITDSYLDELFGAQMKDSMSRSKRAI